MAPNLIDGLRSSSLATHLSPAEVEWFVQQPHRQSAPTTAPAGGKRRRASLALVLREVEGRVELLVIKRTVSPRCGRPSTLSSRPKLQTYVTCGV